MDGPYIIESVESSIHKIHCKDMENKVSQWVNCAEKPLDINDFNHRPLLKNPRIQKVCPQKSFINAKMAAT